MPNFMKMLNNISRSQATYRCSKISADDLQPNHYAFVLLICRTSGCSQEDIARELCVNKSTVARTLNYLEEKGYVSRTPQPNDRRQFSVSPTEKMLAVLPEIKKASAEWRLIVSKDIPQDEFDVFISVLERMHERAREITERQEADK